MFHFVKICNNYFLLHVNSLKYYVPKQKSRLNHKNVLTYYLIVNSQTNLFKISRDYQLFLYDTLLHHYFIIV